MSLDAVATFAQIIPVLLIAAFLSNVSIGTDRASRLFAYFFIGLGFVGEATCLIHLTLSKQPATFATAFIFAATIYMLIAVMATMFVAINQQGHGSRKHHATQHENRVEGDL